MTAEDDLLDRVLDISLLALRSIDVHVCEDHAVDPGLEWFRAGIAYLAGSVMHNLGDAEPGAGLRVSRVVQDGFAAMAARSESQERRPEPS